MVNDVYQNNLLECQVTFIICYGCFLKDINVNVIGNERFKINEETNKICIYLCKRFPPADTLILMKTEGTISVCIVLMLEKTFKQNVAF